MLFAGLFDGTPEGKCLTQYFIFEVFSVSVFHLNSIILSYGKRGTLILWDFLSHDGAFTCCPHITNWLLCEVTLSCSAHPFLTLYFPFYFPIHASVWSGPIRSILFSCSVSSNFPTSFIRWGRWGSGERKSPFCKAQRWHSSSSSSS